MHFMQVLIRCMRMVWIKHIGLLSVSSAVRQVSFICLHLVCVCVCVFAWVWVFVCLLVCVWECMCKCAVCQGPANLVGLIPGCRGELCGCSQGSRKRSGESVGSTGDRQGLRGDEPPPHRAHPIAPQPAWLMHPSHMVSSLFHSLLVPL